MKKITVNGTELTPSKIVCIGRNYVEHIKELGNEVPQEMVVFNKPNSALSSQLNAFAQETLHYEGEICFVVQGGKFTAVGFGLDLTKRELQSKLKEKGLPWERAKAFDGSAVLSDFVSIADTDINQELTLSLSIDDVEIQSGGVALMMYKPAAILAELSSFMTLVDGDIVMTGTPKGVGEVRSGAKFTGQILLADKVLVEQSWRAR
ncbi:2-keto-4-pentenoate hydratase [Thalassotalea insulae]|uniref:2-keto-4-pentenoate hydratase n=1 Tax=Thalassotalea insulae TaxID=2056778 RepID=A0ABQ6GQV0_9GAMM|nr:fumarylacetoacetate hydrolase family protein [Thalassotalea insulae]GLX77060.1 2-keto-4-pentenoate hydratase [Thalassotalea insulae]